MKNLTTYIRENGGRIAVVIMVGVVLTGLFLINRHDHNSGYWEGEGEVNLFPVDATSKNYRVKTYMRVEMKPRGFYGNKKTYDVDYVIWPNGGKTYFEQCEVIPLDRKSLCTDNDYRDWRVEVQIEPDPYVSGY